MALGIQVKFRGDSTDLDRTVKKVKASGSDLANTFCGIVRPICLAALRLISSSNFVGCSTGRSAALAPFMYPTVSNTCTALALYFVSRSVII
jgi:hypothetical protein